MFGEVRSFMASSLLVADAGLFRDGGAPASAGAPFRPLPRPHPAYLPQLDGVRGLACLMVLVAHLKGMEGLQGIDDRWGTAGVGLFFALSGFLITRILLTDKLGGKGLNAFYNRRAARIFPIYYLMLGVLWWVAPGKEIGWAATFTFNLHHQTGVREYFHIDAGGGPALPPVAHVWSLCVEEHFYWFWPCLVWWLPRSIVRWLPAAAMAATPGATYLLARELNQRGFQDMALEGLLSRWTPTQWVALNFGALVALNETRLLGGWRVFGKRLSALGILGMLALGVGIGGTLAVAGSERRALRCLDSTFFHLGCGGLFALGLAWPGLGKARPLVSLGRISYGLYLFHLPIYAAFGLAEANAAVAWPAGLGAVLATFALAWASFRWLEEPILRWTRTHQDRGTIGWGRCRLSVGSLATLVLGAVCLVQVVQWVRNHPWLPPSMRYGAVPAGYRWMGVFHAMDSNGFRRTQPFPVRDSAVPRIAVVGDSYAFGHCVEADQVLAAQAEGCLRRGGIAAEVLNMGICGSQAENVVGTIRDHALPMGAQVVVYAATVDDFVPGGQGSTGYTLKMFLEDPSFARRFRTAVRAMRDSCKEAGAVFRVLPFTQSPDDAENLAVVRRIQDLCRQEGVPLIDIEAYLQANAGRNFRFHPADSHPNAACHRLYGEMLARDLGGLLSGSRPGH